MVDIASYIDDRNRRLYKEVSATFSLTVEYGPGNEYGIFTQNRTAIIYIPRQKACIAFFTHELLHLYLEQHGYMIGATLLRLFLYDPVLSKYYKRELIEHIGNSLQHEKMLRLFLEMGFKRETFILDYHEHKCTQSRLAYIKTLINSKSWSIAAADFIAVFFAMKACPNPSFNYGPQFARLHKIEPDLYAILNTFWQANKEYKAIPESPVETYRGYTNEFVEELTIWTLSKELGVK